MRPTVTRGARHNYQKPENWDDEKDGPCGDLQVRKELYGSRGIVQCVSTWKPSADELRALLAGGVVELAICAIDQPPCAVYVVDPVEIAPHPLDGVSVEECFAQGRNPLEPAPTRPVTINEHAHGDDSHGS